MSNMYVWGEGSSGQTGLNSAVDVLTPTQLTGNWTKVSCNFDHVLAIKSDGTLWGWGTNTYNQCGVNTSGAAVIAPSQVGTDTDWSDVAAGNGFSVALKTNGAMYGFGQNVSGRMAGIAGTATPALIDSGPWSKVATAYDITVGIKTDGTLWATGRNSDGQIGQYNNYTNKTAFTQESRAYTDWAQLCTGGSSNSSFFAIRTGGALYYTGNYDLDGVATSLWDARYDLAAPGPWSMVSTDSNNVIGVKTDGTLWAWGFNANGQLGDGSIAANTTTPTQIGTATNWVAATTRASMAAAFNSAGELYTWGVNASGQLGSGNTTTNYNPTKVNGLANITKIEVGYTPSVFALGTAAAAGGGTAALYSPQGILLAEAGPPAAHGDAALQAPGGVLVALGGASALMSAPSGTLEGFSGASASVSPLIAVLWSAGHPSLGERAAFLTAPAPALKVYTGAVSSVEAPIQGLMASGTVTRLGSAGLTCPVPMLQAAATASGTAWAALGAPSPNLAGYSGAVCSITTTSKHTVVGTGRIGSVGGITATAPLFTLTASATRQNSGSAILTAPVGRLATTGAAWIIAPGATLTAVGTAVVTATYEAYALNLNHPPAQRGIPEIDELTRYTNFPFTHIVRYQNSYYGANSTGLYLLEGTTDDGALIDWEVETAITDFGSPQLKTVEMAYFGGRFGPETAITLIAGETTTNAYTHTTPRGAAAQNHRQPFGRGQKARYYALGASGDGEVTVDSITLNIATLARKV